MKSSRREKRSGMGLESNKRKVKNEKKLLQIQLDIDRDGIYFPGTPSEHRGGETERLGYMITCSICMLFWANSRRRRRSDNDFTPEIIPIRKHAMGSGVDLTLREKMIRIHLNCRCCDQTFETEVTDAISDHRRRANVKTLMLFIARPTFTCISKMLLSKVMCIIFRVYIWSVWPAIHY